MQQIPNFTAGSVSSSENIQICTGVVAAGVVLEPLERMVHPEDVCGLDYKKTASHRTSRHHSPRMQQTVCQFCSSAIPPISPGEFRPKPPNDDDAIQAYQSDQKGIDREFR